MKNNKSILQFQIILCSLIVLVSCKTGTDNQTDKKKTNIIIFIADDAAWDDSGAYGNQSISTPNIDILAKEGLQFNNMILTTSSCSPSRASIMTGQYPHNTGAGELHLPLPLDRVIFPGLLKDAGYYTVSAGKWHLGPKRSEFDSIFLIKEKSGAVDWVKSLKNRPKEKPFFMWFASRDPHRGYESGILEKPHDPAKVVVPPYIPDNDSTRKDLAMYYDEISRLDLNIGNVLTELKKQGIYDNTIIIYMTDNGRPFPRDKTRLYRSGVKSPFIVRWGDRINPGKSDALLSSIDLAPTLCDIARIDPSPQFQGKSFKSILLGEDKEINQYVFSEHNWHDFEAYERGVHSKNHLFIKNWIPEKPASPATDIFKSITYKKMIDLHSKGELADEFLDTFKSPRASEEFYDVNRDKYQMRNLLISESDFAQIASKYRKILEDWRIRTHDSLPAKLTPDAYNRTTGERLENIAPRKRKDFNSKN